MKYYNLIIGEEKVSFKVPTSWSEVSYEVYCKYVDIVEKSAKSKMEDNDEYDMTELHGEILSLFTGLDKSIWEKDVDVSVYNNIDVNLKFISSEPITDRATDIEVDDKFYPITKDFMNMPLGKYRDILTFISQGEGLSKAEQMMLVPKMISVLACINYDTEDELEEIALKIKDMPADEINTLGGFFLSKLLMSRSGIAEKLSAKDLRILKNKRVTEKFQRIMASFTLYITLPMEMSRSIRKSLVFQFKRYIGLSSYKVVSVMPKQDIVKLVGS